MTGYSDARLYLVAPASLKAGTLADLIPELADAGVDVVQLREKDLDAGRVLELAGEVHAACQSAGIPFVINDRPDLALALDCDLHLGQDDVPDSLARKVAPRAAIGHSTHSPEQITAALDAEMTPAYIAVGPVYETPTKPGRPGTGLGLIEYAATSVRDIPWFAIGGIDEQRLPEVMDAGARRVVVVRAITQVDDPVAATRRLRRLLDAVPLTT